MAIIQGSAKQRSVRSFYPKVINGSLRFNDDDSAYLSWTPASAGNRKTWTWSGWVKRSELVSGNLSGALFSWKTGAAFGYLAFYFDGVRIYDSNTGMLYQTNAVYRDVSAWYHVVLSVDTTQATASNRVRLYVNGEEVTSFSTETNPSQNADTNCNNNIQHTIGLEQNDSDYFDGYLAEVHFTDGTAYDADAFGELKSGVWVAKTPSVTYGTNGFYLDFANSADIGNDISGNANDWTPNNFTASDVVLDSPTDNFATLSSVDNASGATLSNGNLETTSATANYKSNFGTIFVSSGKWYAEFTVLAGSNDSRMIAGVGTKQTSVTTQLGNDTYSYSINYDSGNSSIFKRTNNSNTILTSTGNLVNGSVIMIALDLDNNKLWFGQDGTWYDSGAPESGTNEIFSITGSREYTFMPCTYDDGKLAINFGQLGFTYTPPTGYLALSTANLPDPVIDPAQDASPEDYFDTVLYTGVSGDNVISSLQFQPDFVWLKGRNEADSHVLTDAVRGATKTLISDSTASEVTNAEDLASFDTNGFTTGTNDRVGGLNDTMVGWCWKANGSGISNTDGSITSTVSANTDAGFSIVSYTGNGVDGATVGHGLASAPEMVILKNRSDSVFWRVYHSGLTSGYTLYLNSTNAETSGSGGSGGYISASGASTFTLAESGAAVDLAVNQSAKNYIAYCFHSVEGFSKFGSYVGNGSATGTFVYCGFRPAFVMVKRTDSTGSWFIWDTVRETINPLDQNLYANLSNAEGSGNELGDALSNGFKIRGTGAQWNASGGTFIFMAFAEDGGAFKYSRAR